MADSDSKRESICSSRAETIVVVTETAINPRKSLSRLHRVSLLIVFCIVQFLDVFSNSLFAAIPRIAEQLNMTDGESVWTVSATQLTFAAFLLLSGRISDVYDSKYVFISGVACLAIVSLGLGLVRDKIVFFVLRAISGIFVSLTIPSALNLIVKFFPEPAEQSQAIAAFGSSGAVCNVLGLLLGAVLTQFGDWPWVFWFTAIAAVPVVVASVLLIPSQREAEAKIEKPPGSGPGATTMQGLDVFGVSLLTIAFALFIFALTEGSTAGWGIARVVAPLILSVLLIAGFLLHEAHIPATKASVPPRTWFYPNFSVLFGTALMPYFWWTSLSLIFTTYWQDVFHWSVISTAVHMLPIAISAFIIGFTGPLSRRISPKWLILSGEILLMAAAVLLTFTDRPQRYWPFVFPAFTLGSAGAMLACMHSNIAMFRATPSRMAGTVGAIFNTALRLGSAVGSAVVASISTAIEEKAGPQGFYEYRGRAVAFWFIFATVAVELMALLVFYDPRRRENDAEENDEQSLGSSEAHSKTAGDLKV